MTTSPATSRSDELPVSRSPNETPPSLSASAAAEGKNHTFRKRRLSLPSSQHVPAVSDDADAAAAAPRLSLHPSNASLGGNLLSYSAAAAVAALVEGEDCVSAVPCTPFHPPESDERAKLFVDAAAAIAALDESDDDEHAEKAGCGVDASAMTPLKSFVLDVDNEKAHTFRKRRLSLTVNKSTLSPSPPPPESGSSAHSKNRRFSMDSNNSVSSTVCSGSNNNNERAQFVSRTVHSGELIGADGVPPPSPAGIHGSHVLYQQTSPPPLPPPVLELGTAARLLPKWKRRQTLNPQTELHKLPFSRELVGTYSCHGVEPVYSNEYEEEFVAEDAPLVASPRVIHAFGDGFGATSEPPDHQEDCSSAPNASTEPLDEAPPVTVAKINQDRGGVSFPYGNCPKTALFAVYDGHGLGGELVSQFALHEVQRRLEKHPFFPADLEKSFIETFLAVDLALSNEPLIDPLFAGTTACVALLQDRTLTLSNAGDSRAVCARKLPDGTYLALDLTADQNPDVPAEMQRIVNAGGYVTMPPAPGLSARVWLDARCTQIGLAMARSIGDHAVATVGVIAEPVVTTHAVTEQDEFLILASDGVWEFLESADAVSIVAANLDRGATKACQVLIEAAAARWHEEEGAYRDDITAIVVRLQDLWKEAKVSAMTESVAEDASSHDAA